MKQYYYLCYGCKRRLDTSTDDTKTVYKHGYPAKTICGYCGAEGFVKIPRKNPTVNHNQYQPTHG